MINNYIKAIATMTGTIIGVGMFSVPYTISKAGIVPFLIYFPILVIVQYFMHKIYAEIVLSTKTRHRAPGYVRRYFGKTQEKFAFLIVAFSLNISLLAYIIVGGIFMHELLGPMFGGSAALYSTIVFVVSLLVTYLGVKMLSMVEFIMAIFLFVVIALISLRGMAYIELDNYILVDWKNILLPYGPILFAIGGTSSIPVVCQIMAWQKKRIKSAIFLGTFIPSALIFIFAIVVAGVTGPETTEAALTGLSQVFGNGIAKASLLFGILAIFTSMFVNIDTIFEIYKLDMKFTKITSWLLTIIIPYSLFIFGFNSAIKVMSLAGAVIGGMIGIIYLLLIIKVHKKPERKSLIINPINKKIALALGTVFILGVIYEVYMTIFN